MPEDNRSFSTAFLIDNCHTVTVWTENGSSYEIDYVLSGPNNCRELRVEKSSPPDHIWRIPDQVVELGENGYCDVKDDEDFALRLSFSQPSAQGPAHFLAQRG